MYSKEFTIQKWNNTWLELEDIASLEEEIKVNYLDQSYKILACPINLAELCLGYVLLEKVHKAQALVPKAPFSGSVQSLSSHEFTVSLEELPPCPSIELSKISALQISKIMANFMGQGGKWDDTGSFHRACIVDLATQKIMHFTEDIGRHNCVDRLAGFAALNKLDLRNYGLFISSRITASLFAKARLAGFRFMVSRSAVSSYAVQRARQEGITLIAFARDKEQRLSVFADSKKQVDYLADQISIPYALVLAGGLSKRLGQDKRLMRLHGKQDMLSRTVCLLEKFSPEVFVSCRQDSKLPDSQLPGNQLLGNQLTGYNFIYDAENSEGPLIAILSALRQLKKPFLVLSCDLPFINAKILNLLLEAWQNKATGALLTTFKQEESGYIEALVAIYEPEALPYFEKAYLEGQRQLNLVIPDELRQDIIYNSSQALPFFNINYPADLELAIRYLKSGQES